MILYLLFLSITSFAATRDVDGNVTADAATRNDTLFDSTVAVEPTFQQDESFTVQSNVMYGCVDTTLNGRQDNICQTNPRAPECVGLRKTLENATNCLEYFVPATLGCRTYGTAEHSSEDWVAFGNNFYSTLSQCATTKTTNDEKKESLKSIIEMRSFDPTNPVGTGPTILSGLQKSGAYSDISVSPQEEQVFLFQNFDDGASRLGYQTGDIIKSAMKKESFLNLVMDSPFVNDLNVVNRSKFESGIENSQMIVARIKESKNLGEESSDPPASTGVLAEMGEVKMGEIKTSASQGSTLIFAAENLPVAPSLPTVIESSNSEFARKPLLAERIAEIERAALERKKNRTIASTEELPTAFENKNAELGSLEISLFQRIRVAYQKQQKGLRSINTKSAASILGLE